MFHYAESDRAHILRCIQHKIFYDFHRDLVILFDKKNRIHQSRLQDILGNPSLLTDLTPDAVQVLEEEQRRNTVFED